MALLRRDQDAAIGALLTADLARRLDAWTAPLESWLGRCRDLVKSLDGSFVGQAYTRIQK